MIAQHVFNQYWLAGSIVALIGSLALVCWMCAKTADKYKKIRYGLDQNQTYKKPHWDQYSKWQTPETPYNPLYERHITMDSTGRMTAWRYQYPCNVP